MDDIRSLSVSRQSVLCLFLFEVRSSNSVLFFYSANFKARTIRMSKRITAFATSNARQR